MRKRILCLLMVIALCGSAAAASVELQAMTGSGQCGDNITWNLDAIGNLTITGTGDFYGEDSENYLPWCKFARYIVSVSISNGIAYVPDYAFQGCDYLESVTMGKDVQEIGEGAFSQCVRLTDFNFTGLETIKEGAFQGCGVVNVEIPDIVTYVDEYTFANCESLSTVTIPATVTAIDESAFFGCLISDVYYAGTAAQWDKIRGGGTDNLAYGSWRVHINSTGPDDAQPITHEIQNAKFGYDNVRFTVKSSGNGFQNAEIAIAFYDANGQYVNIWQDVIQLPYDNRSFDLWLGTHTAGATNAKMIILDEKFSPVCKAVSGGLTLG